ncbi:MAG: DUF393 domain-containing protein [Betaproteobacteria bacterium]|nr:DUF393 domain-containing protein [Betaproteobacteria bacterium]
MSPNISASSVGLPLTIFYDGSCRLCASEVANLAARAPKGQILLVDCSAADFDDEALPLSRRQLMGFIHARDTHGRWLSGVDVFVAAYRAAGMAWVARILAHPRLKPLWDRCYPWVVRHRQHLSMLGAHRVLRFLAHRAARAPAARTCASGRCGA